jgi:hypothetical protein
MEEIGEIELLPPPLLPPHPRIQVQRECPPPTPLSPFGQHFMLSFSVSAPQLLGVGMVHIPFHHVLG